MKTLVKIVTVASLAACLAVAVAYFLGHTTEGMYRTLLVVFTIVYFVSATTWSESKW